MVVQGTRVVVLAGEAGAPYCHHPEGPRSLKKTKSLYALFLDIAGVHGVPEVAETLGAAAVPLVVPLVEGCNVLEAWA